jgi:hypothetical protein
MDEKDEEALMDYVRKLDAHQLQAWIREVRLGHQVAPTDTGWWLWLAERAEQKARSTGDLDWAHIATSTYEYLHAQASREDWNSHLSTSMNLRAYLISKFGNVPGHPLLDSAEIIHMFFNTLAMPYERAGHLFRSVKELGSFYELKKSGQVTNAEFVALMLIREQLREIQKSVNAGFVQPDEQLTKWLESCANLPPA